MLAAGGPWLFSSQQSSKLRLNRRDELTSERGANSSDRKRRNKSVTTPSCGMFLSVSVTMGGGVLLSKPRFFSLPIITDTPITAHTSLSQRGFHLPLDKSNAPIVSVAGSTFVQVEFGRILQKTVVLISVFKLLWYLVEIIQYCSPDISSGSPHVIVTLSTLRNPTMIAIFLETYSHNRRLYMQ